ncbi:hypothetical protein Plhal304r1_c012g0045631 [Plasmopara halstedii]
MASRSVTPGTILPLLQWLCLVNNHVVVNPNIIEESDNFILSFQKVFHASQYFASRTLQPQSSTHYSTRKGQTNA